MFSALQSSDLGCSYSGGSDPETVLTEAGLSFVTHSQSNWKKSITPQNIFHLCLNAICSGVVNTDEEIKDLKILNQCCSLMFANAQICFHDKWLPL